MGRKGKIAAKKGGAKPSRDKAGAPRRFKEKPRATRKGEVKVTVKVKAKPRPKPKRKLKLKAKPASRPTPRRKLPLPPVVQMTVKALDPQQKCGEQTSVQFLYRVDEKVAGRSTPHLVFFDHYGWYCEHGRACPAVAHARKFNRQLARA